MSDLKSEFLNTLIRLERENKNINIKDSLNMLHCCGLIDV